jgi:hypothetical protein
MREFLRGWKRKLGCMTLVIACAFAAPWIRSYSICDDFTLSKHGQFDSLVSVDGQLFTTSGPYRGPDEFRRTTRRAQPIQNLWAGRFEWQWRCCGFGSASSSTQNRTIYLKIIPYWSVVLPLTLMSAYLLLSKPRRPSNQSDNIASNQPR